MHYYVVSRTEKALPIFDLLKVINQKSMEERLMTIGAQKSQLEDIHERLAANKPVWLMKFTRIRDDNWPGVGAAAQGAKDLELEEDQHLSEETFAAYCPESERMVVQYSHFGVRASKIREYLNSAQGIADHGYAFSPVITNEALEKYEKKKIVTAVDVTIDGISEADLALMEGSSLQAALKASIQGKATSFSLSVGVDARLKKNKMDRGWVETLVDAVKRRAGEGDSIVVSAKENEEDTVEAIDLLEARKITKYNADDIDRTAGRRFEPGQMHGLMEQSLREWISSDPP